MNFYSVRVQRADRQKPCNVVIITNSASGAERGARAAYGDRIGHVKSIHFISELDILAKIGEFGDIRTENGEIEVLVNDPRHDAVGAHTFFFLTKFRAPSSHAAKGAHWDVFIPVSANSEDCAWAIFDRLVRNTAERTEIVFPGETDKLVGVRSIHDRLDVEQAGWGQSYTETSDAIAQSANFKSHYAFNSPFMSWDRAADLWQTWFDDRRAASVPQCPDAPAAPVRFTVEQVQKMIQATLPKDCPSAVMSFALTLQEKLVAEARAA